MFLTLYWFLIMNAINFFNVEEVYGKVDKITLNNETSIKLLDSIVKKLSLTIKKHSMDLIEEIVNKPEVERVWVKLSSKLTSSKERKNLKIQARIKRLLDSAKARKLEQICKKHGTTIQKYESFIKEEENPIIKAIFEDNVCMLNVLAGLGADLNNNSENIHPLSIAVLTGKGNMVRVLIENGADIDKEVSDFTALERAIIDRNFKMTMLLLSLGANANRFTKTGETPLSLALACDSPESIIMALKAKGADETYAQELMRKKFLYHVYGKDGVSLLKDKDGINHSIQLHCFTSARYTVKQLKEYVNLFFSEDAENNKQILDVLENVVFEDSDSIKAAVYRAKTGKPLMIISGSKDHYVGILLIKDKLIVSDRSSSKRKTTQIYSLPSKEINEDIIESLRTRAETMTDFYDIIKNHKFRYIEGFNQKIQESNNCAWASPKAALSALLNFFFKENGYKIYKRFTRFTRSTCLKEYADKSTSLDLALVEEFTSKLAKKKIII